MATEAQRNQGKVHCEAYDMFVPESEARQCSFCDKWYSIASFAAQWKCVNPKCTLNEFVCPECRKGDYCTDECHVLHLEALKAAKEDEIKELYRKYNEDADRVSGEICDIYDELSKLRASKDRIKKGLKPKKK